MAEVTQILNQIETGDPTASDDLLALLYDELRILAQQRLAREKPGQTLQATALVHEAWLRLLGDSTNQSWNGRAHFFGAAALAMRRILIENARRKNRKIHGGGRHPEELHDVALQTEFSDPELIELDEALSRLESVDPQLAKIVQLRFFAGLDHQQVAGLLEVSEVTVRRRWRYARAWLRREMNRTA